MKNTTVRALFVALTVGSGAVAAEDDLDLDLDPPAAAAPSEAPPSEAPAPSQTSASSETTATTANATTTAATTAPASSTDTATVHDRGGLFGVGLVLAPRLGGALGAVSFAGAGLTLTPSLEVGYLLPLPDPLNRDLQLFARGSYAAPSADQVVDAGDERVADGTFHYSLTLHQWTLTTGALYRLPVPLSWLRPTVALGLQTVFSRTVVNGDAGDADFATATEDAVDLGVVGSVGADLFVGPGAISVDVDVGYVPADRFVLRATSATAVGLVVGYRFFL